jgi:hypothetical protein
LGADVLRRWRGYDILNHCLEVAIFSVSAGQPN